MYRCLKGAIGAWQAALELHGFKHDAEQLEEKARKVAVEKKAVEAKAAEEQGEQPQDILEEDTGEGLEHLQGFIKVRAYDSHAICVRLWPRAPASQLRRTSVEEAA